MTASAGCVPPCLPSLLAARPLAATQLPPLPPVLEPPPAEQGSVPVPRLRRHAEALLLRVDGVQGGLRSVLSAAIQQRLAAAHWPPPLAHVGGDGGAAAAAAAGTGDGGWRGFAAAGEASAGELQQLLVMLLTLQRASQHEHFR